MTNLTKLIRAKLYCAVMGDMESYRDSYEIIGSCVKFIKHNKIFNWFEMTDELIQREWDVFKELLGVRCATCINVPEFLLGLRRDSGIELEEFVDESAGLHVFRFPYKDVQRILVIPKDDVSPELIVYSHPTYEMFISHSMGTAYAYAYVGESKDSSISVGSNNKHYPSNTYSYLCRIDTTGDFLTWLLKDTTFIDTMECVGTCGVALKDEGISTHVSIPEFGSPFRARLLHGGLCTNWVNMYKDYFGNVTNAVINYMNIRSILGDGENAYNRYRRLVRALDSIDATLVERLDTKLEED